jgi:hypothetical protein
LRVLPDMELIASVEAHAAVAPERVWARLSDGLRWGAWSEASEWMVVEDALKRGRIVTIKRKRGRQTAYRVEAADEPQRLALVLTFGPLASLRLAWELTPDGDGTRIVQTIESGGPLRRWFSDPLARKAAALLAGDPAALALVAASA